MKNKVRRLAPAVGFMIAVASYVGAQNALPSLRDALAGYFTVGVALPSNFVDPTDPHGVLVAQQFGAVVAENATKPDQVQPTEGTFRFAPADKILRFAESHGMVMRGHTLVWHQQTPLWFFCDPDDPTKPVSRDVLLQRMKTHISTVLGHYRGRIRAWDVVNEPLTDDGRLRDGAAGSKWFDIIGASYIDEAFRCAHEADPSALLVINDYNLESSPAKRDGMYDLVKGLLARGVPVGAVGMQMHVSLYGPGAEDVRAAIEKFGSLGVKVEITEMDVSIYRSNEAEKPITPQILDQQAARYADLFNVFKDEAKKGIVDMVVLWGVSDEQSWLNSFPVPGRTNAPLLFDGDLNPKPAFWAVVGKKG